ncbi:MAG TPA: VWA domain-containing protein [Vicinamibacterales bacterium]|nr:VWA domain-containing protein [Vicinamibacterales bacterium]
MSISWTSTGALWLLLLVPAVWAALRFSRTNFGARQRWVQAAVRSLLLTALVLALARPVVSSGSNRLSIVYLVDVSHSIATKAITDAADRIDRLNAELRPDHARVLAFGANVVVLPDTQALRDLAAKNATETAGPVRRESSDIDQALRQARAELLPGHIARIALFTDGRATSGSLNDATLQLAAGGVRVFVEPMAARDIGDTWVDGIDLPNQLPAGGLATATVRVGSQKAGRALVELRVGEKVVSSQPADIGAGQTAVPMDVTFADVGAQRVEASVTMPGDPLAANNRLAREALVGERPRVLYIEGAQQSARYLAGALTGSGFDVTVRAPAGMPQQAADLQQWDAMIVSDVARTAMTDASMKAMSQWVEQDGGGLLVAGGDAVFGEGPEGARNTGYRNTELERITPTTFERKDEPEVALIIVLDKSWSMAGAVMELCKAAAQAAIDVLTDPQLVGVVTFNDQLNWDVTLRNVGKNREQIRKAVSAIEPSGHTLIYPAIEQAYLALKDAHARAKHVVLLSDGRSYPDDYEGLVKKMVESKMTVSSIAVGPAADQELLSNIAKWGKGRSYAVEDAKEVPQIFVKEAKNASTPSFDEKPLKPVVKFRGFLEGVDMNSAPSLRGRTATVVKDNAIQLLGTESGDPLLAFWPIGLGRTAVFASDVKDRWASDWLKWKGYAPFFTSVLRAIARQRPAAGGVEITSTGVSGDARTIDIAIESRDAHGNYADRLKPTVTLQADDGTTATRVARQVLPGRYEASVIADASKTLTVAVDGAGSTRATRLVIPDTAAEYRFRPPDRDVLQSIATATGGAVGATADAIRKASASQPARRALWPGLVLAALGLWLVDILLRRVRILEAG